MACILFIDDDPFALRLFQKAAKLLGHRALLSQNFRSAMDLIEQHKPDLIFVDRNLQDQDGLAIVQAIMNNEHRVPVLVLSAGATWDNEQQALAAGASEFIPKPLSLEQLSQAIQKYIPSTT